MSLKKKGRTEKAIEFCNRIFNAHQKNIDYQSLDDDIKKELSCIEEGIKDGDISYTILNESFSPALLVKSHSYYKRCEKKAIQRCQQIWERSNQQYPDYNLADGTRNPDYNYISGLRRAQRGSQGRRWYPELMHQAYSSAFFHPNKNFKNVIINNNIKRCFNIWNQYKGLPPRRLNNKINPDRRFIDQLRTMRAKNHENWCNSMLNQEFSLEFFGAIRNSRKQSREKILKRCQQIWQNLPSISTQEKRFLKKMRCAAKGQGEGSWFDELFKQEFSSTLFPKEKYNNQECINSRIKKNYSKDQILCQEIYHRNGGHSPPLVIAGQPNPDVLFLKDLCQRLQENPNLEIQYSYYFEPLLEPFMKNPKTTEATIINIGKPKRTRESDQFYHPIFIKEQLNK